MDLITFVLGLLFSIPLGIAVNVLTPKYLGWRAKRSQDAADKLAAEDQKFQARIEHFRGNPGDYQAFFQMHLIQIVSGIARMVMTAGGGILAAVLLPGTIDGEMLGLLAFALLLVDGAFLSARGRDAYRVAAGLRVSSKGDSDEAPQAESSA